MAQSPADRKRKRREKQIRDVNSPYWRRKTLAIWSILIRRIGHCEICKEVNKVLNAHHILPKERYKDYMFALENGISLCQNCHKFSKFSAHFNAIWFTRWLEVNKPEQYRWALNHMDSPEPTCASHFDAYIYLNRLKILSEPPDKKTFKLLKLDCA